MNNETHDTPAGAESGSEPLQTTRRTALRGMGLTSLLAMGVGSTSARQPRNEMSADDGTDARVASIAEDAYLYGLQQVIFYETRFSRTLTNSVFCFER
ncbi:hypothetical protein SAMN05421858_4210 [Haladaptatus litoreus]|uniref:Uncharacterized protein n=1 Tax=Haladaptatus litoreus TaxID=553468 RepID=A0A1N7EG57_9EURY|nr:hypothetical protein [Haladaptatus litoreus]SIR87067.1 hypothetical protein SAMN05421858_4210 [Haladaptatus litoreus]